MKFIVAVDCEGPACVVGHPGGGLNSSSSYEFACQQATREANAAAKGLFDGGADQVIVWDNHGSGVNLDYEKIDSRCQIALGSGFEQRRFPGIDETFAGVIFIGYHAMDSTDDAVLAHTYSSNTYQYFKINGQMVGEMAIDAAYAGKVAVPPILAVGDDKMVHEAQQFFPDIKTVTTKWAKGFNCAISKHPLAILDETRSVAKDAAASDSSIKPFSFDEPIEVEIRYKRIEDAQSRSRDPKWQRVDTYTVSSTVAHVEDAF